MKHKTYKQLYKESKVLNRCKTLLDFKRLWYQTNMIEHNAVKQPQYISQESGAGTQEQVDESGS